MKVILSRKGFDSSYGGFPSIILPKEMGSKMISFPIPDRKKKKNDVEQIINYCFDKTEIAKEKKISLINLLSKIKGKKKIKMPKEKEADPSEFIFHVDPEIQNMEVKDENANGEMISFYNRKLGSLGQSSAAAGHLLNNDIDKISANDPTIFLFFGWFNNTEWKNKQLIPKEKSFHAIWGYLIVDATINISSDPKIKIPEKLKNHPHIINKDTYGKKTNIIFYGEHYGTLPFNEKLRLTKKDSDNRSNWEIHNLWKGMNLKKDEITMTYNSNKIKSKLVSNSDKIEFTAASIGQEFIIKNANPKELEKWLIGLGLPRKALDRLKIKQGLCTTSK